MSLTEIIKGQPFFKELIKKKEGDKLASSILFFCEDEVTGRTALILTALMLEYQTYDLFDENSAEYVKISSGVDLDVKMYPKNGDKLLVADSNEIVSEAFVRPVNLPKKIFIINNFDVSTEEAQNKLLKILEEPPSNVLFLLSAKSEDKVLATIKSRCDKIKISPLCFEEISKLCNNKLACTLGGGWVGKTLTLAKKEDLQAVADFAVSLVCELKNSKQVLNFSKRFLEEKENLDLILQIFSLALEDIIKIKCESENLCKLTGFLSQLKEVEQEFSVRAICEINSLVAKLSERREFNANMTVAIDNFLLKMLEVKYLCK